MFLHASQPNKCQHHQPISGDIAAAYDTLCEMEIAQSAKNPGNKGVFSEVTSKIRDLCVRFSNQQATCKTFLKKPAPKAKSSAKRQPKPKPGSKEEIEE